MSNLINQTKGKTVPDSVQVEQTVDSLSEHTRTFPHELANVLEAQSASGRASETDEQYRDRKGDEALTEILAVDRAEIYKDCLASVTGSLEAYAESFHNFRCLRGIPFSTCPSDICTKGRAAIDKAIQIIAGGSDVSS